MDSLRKQAFSITLAGLCLLILAFEAFAGEGSDPFPGVASSYLLQVNGKPVWAHQPRRKLAPASLTKVMTSLIALEKGNPEDIVTVGPGAARETGSRLGLRRGEKMAVTSLLAASLIGSANDASRSLADYAGKSGAGFIPLMNRKAKELGMKGTHFTNPCGHDHPDHYSTAYDLALLTEAALKKKTFAEMVGLLQTSVTTVGGRRFVLENKNKMIGRYPGAVGVKTGYTPIAGKCLIALAQRNGTRVLLVLLNAPNRWWDAEEMLNKAFDLPRTGEKS